MRKKNKVWAKYIAATPENVAKLLIGIKAVLVSISVAEFIIGKPDIAFYLLIATGIVNEVANFLTSKNDTP